MTYYDATFWVGANAVIRKRALDDIAETSYVGGWEIRHYIQDRTVIEDTESTIDMGIHGWRCSTTRSGSATAPPRRTSARCASSAGAGPTAAC